MPGELPTAQYMHAPPPEKRKMPIDIAPALTYIASRSNNSRRGSAADPGDISSAGHVFLVNHLVRAIGEDREPYVTGESARGAIDLILAIYESARTGREVEIPHTG